MRAAAFKRWLKNFLPVTREGPSYREVFYAAYDARTQNADAIEHDYLETIWKLSHQLRIAEETLVDLRDAGVRHDLHPTCLPAHSPSGENLPGYGSPSGGWTAYLTSIDHYVREKSRGALQAMENVKRDADATSPNQSA